jgi:hypothetical protein
MLRLQMLVHVKIRQNNCNNNGRSNLCSDTALGDSVVASALNDNDDDDDDDDGCRIRNQIGCTNQVAS